MVTSIRISRMPDGRMAAHLVQTHEPLSVGAESSLYGLTTGRDPETEAVEYLRRLYPDLPADLPIQRV